MTQIETRLPLMSSPSPAGYTAPNVESQVFTTNIPCLFSLGFELGAGQLAWHIDVLTLYMIKLLWQIQQTSPPSHPKAVSWCHQ